MPGYQLIENRHRLVRAAGMNQHVSEQVVAGQVVARDLPEFGFGLLWRVVSQVISCRDVVALIDVASIQLTGPSQLGGGFGCLAQPVLNQATPEPVVGRLWFGPGGLLQALVRLGKETVDREGLSEYEPVATLRVLEMRPQIFEVSGGLSIDHPGYWRAGRNGAIHVTDDRRATRGHFGHQ